VFIRKEARSKHKYITSVKGLDGFGCDLKKAAKSFSKKFACSASVVKLADGGLEIQIQGDVLTELPDFIIAEFRGVDKSALFFMDKANKKTRCF
jgi:density-regulated protein DRP1